jgi:hypothetical protein
MQKTKLSILPHERLSEANQCLKIPQNYDRKISEVLSQIVDLTFVSEKGHGKTVACENLALKITENPKNRLIVFESFPKWINEFPKASFLEIPQDWIVETSKAINLEKTWVQHERGFTVLHGDIISQFLRENQNCIFLVNNDDIEAIAFFIYSVIYRFYRQKYDLLRKGYRINEHVYFVLEEAQNSLDAKILSSKLFRRYRKLFSEMRNMDLRAILITQRLQDLSTYFRCRTSLAIGKIGLDDYDLKLKRMLKPIQNQIDILNLPKGSFYFSAINDIVHFPEFQTAKAKEWIPKLEPKPKPKGLKDVIKAWFTSKPKQKIYLDRTEAKETKEEVYYCESCGSEMTKEEYEESNGICELCDTDIISEKGEDFEDLF